MADTQDGVGQKGRMIVVVGPSGAGKDSLIAYAKQHFAENPHVHFVQRVITRPANAGGEDHNAATPSEFDDLKAAGRFAVDWDAHGLSYGIPQDACSWLSRGDVVIANGSRSVLPCFQRAFAQMTVVNVTATADVLADRLEARGRENRDEILRRLERSSLEIVGDYHVVTLDNSGILADAGERFLSVINDCLPKAS
ncbi:phosphonate metabolism protein/1,5-bisphosphokinase (PRPP-forming) PhnN [Rhizobium oryziradicis]|uniref:Ribose 1,5-bisphosphate phosphokinase PhnN n=1 Tax=Rhizobium oryziradicis TaxID=1867956 RepID=A0A1Q8ZTA9_9HYPH|nr:phosphonate metabolism protein/1,5-bisphosphokinase (PRPP-forming) PhnN [Rhizobium oryziradicis]OLP45234.1 phosphonate metabolism protein/1,5-bisphosphokinase (PRPP-forming) PhnN [Rhizobium oryziradicis]